MAKVLNPGHGPGAHGAEPQGGATPSKQAYPIGSFTLTGDPRPCDGCGTWVKPNVKIPDGASIAEQDQLLRRGAMAGRCGKCPEGANAINGGSFHMM